jgi:RNA polymerase sigma factor (sigma-70 family)
MSEHLTEEELWQLAVDGDPAARSRIAELADRYSRLTLQRQGVRPCDLDDLVQEALLGVERCRASCRAVRVFRKFVYFRSLSILKTHRSRQRLRNHGELDSELARSDQAAPDSAAQAVELLQAVARCRDALPESLRMVVNLRHTNDCTLPEIAERLSLSLGGVRDRLRRAWQLLHTCLRSRGFACEDDPA